MFTTKKCTHPAPLHHFVMVGPFEKWGIEFVHCRPILVNVHGYIIVAMDYFTKWVEAMLTYVEEGNTTDLFRIPRAIVTDHGSHL